MNVKELYKMKYMSQKGTDIIVPLYVGHTLCVWVCVCVFVCVCTKSFQSCPTLCNTMDCSLPGSSMHGILQARIPEWVAIPSSRGSSLPRSTQICKQKVW